jgi:hypothetical protein
MPFDPSLAFTAFAIGTPDQNIQRGQPRLQYSAVTSTETRLPDGIRPASLLGSRTGWLLLGDLVSGHRAELERTVRGSLQYIQQVAAALPIDRGDENVVDALIAKRVASLATRPLRRRDGEPR